MEPKTLRLCHSRCLCLSFRPYLDASTHLSMWVWSSVCTPVHPSVRSKRFKFPKKSNILVKTCNLAMVTNSSQTITYNLAPFIGFYLRRIFVRTELALSGYGPSMWPSMWPSVLFCPYPITRMPCDMNFCLRFKGTDGQTSLQKSRWSVTRKVSFQS